MRCRTCDYVLWNLAARQCPECGEHFAPSEFEFVPNSVKFCCPKCNQAYFGTSERGHLVPDAFTCVKCGEAITMDAMVLRPGDGVTDRQTAQVELPWQDRERRGLFKAWARTLFLSIGSPVRLIHAASRNEGGIGAAWWYLTFTLLIVTIGGVLLPGAAIMLFDQARGRGVDANDAIAWLLALPIGAGGILLGVLIWGAIAHGLLRITGQCEGKIGQTYQCLCYSAGPMVIAAIPLIGLYCFTFIPVPQVWWVILAIIMVQASQSVSGLRATFAVATFPALLVLTAVLSFFGLIYFSVSMAQTTMARMGPMTGGNWPSGNFKTSVLQSQLDALHLSDGQWPAHALQLVDSGSLSAIDFLADVSDTTASDVPVGDSTLAEYEFARPSEQGTLRTSEAAMLPADVIAHRVGDFVFTYHGVDPNGDALSLWTIIMIEDPDAAGVGGAASPPLDPIYVAQADGTIRGFARSALAAELASQNDLRKAAGLPALPDPLTIRHRTPATAPRTEEVP